MESKSWIQPQSAANETDRPLYPHVTATVTDSGHSFEMDDTPNRERVRLYHSSGTFIEMQPNGDIVVNSKGTIYDICANGKNVAITGHCNIVVNGDCSTHVTGNYNLLVDGDYIQKVAGEYKQLSSDSSKSDSKITNGDLVLNATGAIVLNADRVVINTDLTVGGDIGGNQTISAIGNITSQMSVMGIMSIRSPGSLMIGPTAAIMPTSTQGVGYIDVGLNVGLTSGFLNVIGISSVTGSHNVTNGVITCTGLIESTTDVIAGITSLRTHIHGNGNMGSPTTPPLV